MLKEIKRDIHHYGGRPLCFVFVGLPARGKSYIGKRISRYINWLGIRCMCFDTGLALKVKRGNEPPPFYTNIESKVLENEVACEVAEEVCTYLKGEGKVAVIISENPTKQRRDVISDTLMKVVDKDRIIFVEVMQTNPNEVTELIKDRIRNSPGCDDLEQRMADYQVKIHYYEKLYETIDEGCYIKFINNGKHMVLNKVTGYLPTRVANYLSHLDLNFNTFYCSRHGESEYNTKEKLGGDSGLSPLGLMYSKKLYEYVKALNIPKDSIEIWTSTLKRTRMTAQPLTEDGYTVVHWRALDEINAGICDGMTYKEIEKQMPEEFRKRKEDKYMYRYPKGESYHDLVQRIEPVIMELERVKKTIFIVCHQAVLRVLYAYMMQVLPENCVRSEINLHTVFKFVAQKSGEITVTPQRLLDIMPKHDS